MRFKVGDRVVLRKDPNFEYINKCSHEEADNMAYKVYKANYGDKATFLRYPEEYNGEHNTSIIVMFDGSKNEIIGWEQDFDFLSHKDLN